MASMKYCTLQIIFFSNLWMIRSHDGGNCEEFWVVDGYGDQAIPPADAFWDSYTCACNNIDYQYRCNFRISCLHTKTPSYQQHSLLQTQRRILLPHQQHHPRTIIPPLQRISLQQCNQPCLHCHMNALWWTFSHALI